MSDGWPCPHCGQTYGSEPDPTGMVSCPTGHRAYSGYLAERAALRERLVWLDARVGAGDPPPDEETARRYGIWPAAPTSGPTAAAAAVDHQPVGAQVVLLGLGAALLIVAAIVFTAVVWDQLGAAGKVGVMALATLGFGAVAVRLSRRLAGTAESLAVVTFGLAVVDVVAAPAMGLVPEAWLYPDRLYLAALAVGAGALFAGLGRWASLQAWSWLGWSAVALGGGLLTWWLMVDPLREQPGRALALSVLTLWAVGLLAGSLLVPVLAPDRGPLRLAAVVATALAAGTLPAALYELDRPAFLGTAGTLLVTTGAILALARAAKVHALVYVAATLGGAAGGLLLLALPDTQDWWLAVVVALAGVLVLVVASRLGSITIGLVVSAVAWATWGLGRLAVAAPRSIEDPVYLQLAVVLTVAALCWWVVAIRPTHAALAWAAAFLAEFGWLCVLPRLGGIPEIPEATWLPFGVFLVVGGWVWHRAADGKSLAWLGPGVGVVLLPAAIACWGAPWVWPFSDQSNREATIRLLLVLLVGLALVLAGVRLRLAGLFVPGAAALAVAGAAQLWGGAQAMPRWIAMAFAGTVLIVLGARIEWLRRGGRRARTYLGDLH